MPLASVWSVPYGVGPLTAIRSGRCCVLCWPSHPLVWCYVRAILVGGHCGTRWILTWTAPGWICSSCGGQISFGEGVPGVRPMHSLCLCTVATLYIVHFASIGVSKDWGLRFAVRVSLSPGSLVPLLEGVNVHLMWGQRVPYLCSLP